MWKKKLQRDGHSSSELYLILLVASFLYPQIQGIPDKWPDYQSSVFSGGKMCSYEF